MKRAFFSTFVTLAMVNLATSAFAGQVYSERFRPQFHFTPEKNWMNDPNGLVWLDGEYHLFYQYNPFGDKWGHMSWGHAVSRDLVHWEHLPIALPEDGDIMMFSGCAVVDFADTAGFGKDALVAVYTGHNEKKKRQDQRLAYSTDRGRTWTQYSGNPVLDIDEADFRDPKVFWHEGTSSWVMVVAMSTDKKVRFFSSPDLKKWTQLSEFGPAGSTIGLWECPDLFPLPVDGEAGSQKWVLIVNVNPGGPAGGSGCQYFIGDFDGKEFRLDAGQPGGATQAETEGAQGRVLADFEGTFDDWTAEGPAFGKQAAHPDPSGDIKGFEGTGLADSFGGGDHEEGTLSSPHFVIDSDTISFLIGGGNHPDQLGIRLVIDGETVLSATGNNSPQLEPQSWDVKEFRGKTAKIELFDNFTGGDWGHIFVDQIILGGEGATRPSDLALWADYGSDFYAGVTWSDIAPSDGRRLLIGWMSNWAYAEKVPTAPWRSAMTVPRSLKLARTADGLRLAQEPVLELEKLRKGKGFVFPGGSFAEAAKWLSSQRDLPELLDLEMSFTGVSAGTPFSITLQTGAGESTAINVDPAKGKISIDRAQSGVSAFHASFAARHEAPLEIAGGSLTIRCLLDASSLEVFAQQGTAVLTDLIFPAAGSRSLELSSTGHAAPQVRGIVIHPLTSSWRTSGAEPASLSTR